MEVTPMSISLLGNAADEYLWAHGYLQKTVDLIQWEYEQSYDMEDFVNALAKTGMAVAEAQYLYKLISRQR